MTTKSLDTKLQNILSNPSCGDFILADAKDADMAFGLAAPGQSPEMHAHEGQFRTLTEYRQIIRENVAQGLVDIMLMSASTNEVLTLGENLFENTHVTPAIRANDTTDVWLASGSSYASEPARPFRTATLDHAMCGKVSCEPNERKRGADLGLYAVTFNNDIDLDLNTLNAYRDFRAEAERKGFRHFLEVFDPNAPLRPIADIPRFLNDMIARLLAGVAGKGRPIFLKIPYDGPAAIEALAGYDRNLVVGILGGSSGTTFDAFSQLWEAKKYGARVALYGRMINHSEHQLTFIKHLRAIADGHMQPTDAVKSYHSELAKLNINPYRDLQTDLQPSSRGSAYQASAGKPSASAANTSSSTSSASPSSAKQGDVDFDKMTQEEKIRWNLDRWNRVLG
ncbi:MAG: hypothetical protein JKX85_09890 [Phycisphaeraceae bacterium]|nr:hypothetical protein [Phycisphaeraceae bacterium]